MADQWSDNEDKRVVAVGLLTRSEVTLLGAQLSRLYPLRDDSKFSDLLEAIDEADRSYHRAQNAGGD